MSTRILSRLILSSSKLTVGIENVTLSRIPLRYYLDSVTVILTAPSLQMYVMSRAVTEQIVTQSRRLVEFSVSKWLKLTQFHLFTPLFGWKKQLCNGKTHKKYEIVRFEIGSVYTIIAGLQWKFLNFHGVLHRFPLITRANSQVCFKWMSKCVI